MAQPKQKAVQKRMRELGSQLHALGIERTTAQLRAYICAWYSVNPKEKFADAYFLDSLKSILASDKEFALTVRNMNVRGIQPWQMSSS